MSMVESPVRESAAAVRRRLLNPAGGHDSSEIEIVSKNIAQRMRYDNAHAARCREIYERELVKKARHVRAAELMREYQCKLSAWILDAIDEPRPPEIPKVLFEQILLAVTKFYDIPRIHMLSRQKTAAMVAPRHMAMFLGCELTELSLPQIGAKLGGRDHTTVLHGRDKIKDLLAAGDEKITAEVAAIKDLLEAT